MLLVAEPAAVPPGAAGIDGQAEPLHDERKARLTELGRQIARIRHDVNGVLAVGVVPTARSPTEDFPHQVGRTVGVGPIDTGVPDRLLVSRHATVDSLGDGTSEHTEQAEDHERPGIRRGGEDG